MGLRLTASTVIDAPRAACWARMADLDQHLPRITPPRVRIRRHSGSGPATEPGTAWDVAVQIAGQGHRGEMRVIEALTPERCVLRGGTAQLAVALTLQFRALGADQTTLSVDAVVTALSLPGRVLLKPLQLIQPALDQRLKERVDWVVARMMGPELK